MDSMETTDRHSDHSRGPILPMAHAVGQKAHQKIAFLSHTQRTHLIAMIGEFVGTTLFLWFGFSGAQVANTIQAANTNPTQTDASTIFYLALIFGFSLMVNVWIFYRISGGLFNPAITLGLVISGALPPIRGALLFVPQFAGGMVASGLVSAMFPGPMAVDTTLGHGTSIAQGLFIEMFLTSLLMITVLMLAVEKSKTTFLAPIGIGLALFVAHLSGAYFTGASLNPTRSFGPQLVTRSFPGYHWIYWLGPVFGACIAAGFYRFIKFLVYEEANPCQDSDGTGNCMEKHGPGLPNAEALEPMPAMEPMPMAA